MKNKIITILAAVSILCTLVIANTALAANDDIVSDDSFVTQKEADNAAQYFMKEFTSLYPIWAKAKISNPVTYYSIAENSAPIAYEYTLIRAEESVGFMFISATKNLNPLLECSGGKAPSSYLNSVKTTIDKTEYVSDDTTPLLLYWGALTYSVQYNDQMKKDGVAIHLLNGKLQKVPDSINLQIDKNKARTLWNELSYIIANNISIKSDRGLVTINGVPAYYQSGEHGDAGGGAISFPVCAGPTIDPWYAWDGCSPIAGAMIHGYWDSHGYPNLPDGEDTLIDYNHYYMGTSIAGDTWDWNIDDGIRDIFDLCGYDFDVNNTNFTNWNDITTQVDAENPAVMSFTGGTYNGHSTTLVGYADWALYDFIILHDGYDTSGHVISYGDWSICLMTKVEES